MVRPSRLPRQAGRLHHNGELRIATRYVRIGFRKPSPIRLHNLVSPLMAARKSTAVATKRKVAAKKSAVRKVAAAKAPALYSVHPGVAMMERWIAELKVKTGRSLDEWLRHIKSAGPPDEKSCREWLKAAYGLGTNSAWWLAEKAVGDPLAFSDDSPEAYLAACPVYVAEMYAGPRASLQPIHDELVRLAKGLGDDVRICPCQTIVPLYRNHVFAEIKPATNKRIDLGFSLGDEPFTARLVDTGGRAKKNRITHNVALTSPAEIDLQVKRWLREAYERDA